MKIGIIQATSQQSKNSILEHCLREVVSTEHEVINFGIYADQDVTLSYVEVACCISLLLESKSVDFIVTGCSSGQGMMLACNSFAGVLCGYVQDVSDAYLFGRINEGNVISYPLGMKWGWAAELNLKETLRALFTEPLGIGYPPQEAERKKQDAKTLKRIHEVSKRSIIEVLALLDTEIVKNVIHYDIVYNFIMEHSGNEELKRQMQYYR